MLPIRFIIVGLIPILAPGQGWDPVILFGVELVTPTRPSREPLDKPLGGPLSEPQAPDRRSSGSSSLSERRSK